MYEHAREAKPSLNAGLNRWLRSQNTARPTSFATCASILTDVAESFTGRHRYGLASNPVMRMPV